MNDCTRRAFLQGTGALAATGMSPLVVAGGEKVAPVALPPPQSTWKTDVLVCGGGPAGMAAAVMAARGGRKVLLVERYGRLGGMAIQARVAPLMGAVDSRFVREAVKRLGGHAVDYERLDLDYAAMVQEAGAELLLHAWAAGVVSEGNRVGGALLVSKQGVIRVDAAVTVDATGDGDIAWMAGAEFEQGRPGDGLVQPMSIMFSVGGVDPARAIYCGSEEQARQIQLPEGTWEELVTKAQKSGQLPAEVGVVRIYKSRRPGEVGINATQINRVDGTRVADLTRAELECRRQAYEIVDFLKKHSPGYENAYLAAMPAVVGVRETRRFLGVEYLCREDVVSGRKRPDAVVRAASFPIDIHNPAGSGQAEGNAGQGGAARVQPYDIPYGCLVPRKVDGLLLAGRCISGSHDAHASYRVQCIAMATGAAAGVAAAVAVEHGIQPRAVDVAEVQKALA
ncbi:MAG: FAD-dependent oxidoreductase [Thermoguttaceae bacterium]|jgi:hypothetical protein